MRDALDPDALAALQLVAEDRFARPSARVEARKVLRAIRDAERHAAVEADRAELLAVIRRTLDAA